MSEVTLDEIKKWTEDEFQEKIDEVLPAVIKEFNNSISNESCIELFQLLCERLIPFIPVSTLESTIFSKILPYIEHVFGSLVNLIKSQLDGKQEVDVLSDFEQLFQVLDCLEKSISQLALCQKEILLEYVYSLPVATLRISLQSFITFGWFVHTETADESLAEHLSILFNKTSSVLKLFLNLWLSIRINVCFENDVQILVTVCEILNKICRTFGSVTGKPPIALWKTYTSTLVKYCDAIRDRFDVALAVNLLCDDVLSNLSELMAVITQHKTLVQEHEKSVFGLLQICGFNLKIIVNLCEKFKFYLGSCFHSLLHLILTLYNFCGPSLSKPNLPENLVQETERHLSSAIEPLLVQLLAEPQFILLLADQNLLMLHDEDFSFPLCLLYLFVLENILEIADDLQMQLLDPCGVGETNSSLFNMLFSFLAKCEVEFGVPIVLPGVMCHGKPQRMISFYEYTCIKICASISTLPAKYFGLLEKMLLKELISDNLWQSLLASDVWAFLGRLEAPSLCYHHCCVLAEIVAHMDSQSQGSHWCVPLLFKRLFNFLASEHQVKFAHQFPPAQYKTLWLHLYSLCLSDDIFSQQHRLEILTKHTDQIERVILGKYQMDDPPFKTLSDMSFSLRILSQMLRSTSLGCLQIQELLQLCMHVWTFLPSSWNKSSESDSFIVELLSLTSSLIPVMENTHVLKLLNRLPSLQCLGIDAVYISILKIFNSLGAKHLQPTPKQADIFRLCALLLSNFLQEKDSIILLEGLETFSRFSHMTRHGNIVTQCLHGKPALLDIVKKFLNQVPLDSTVIFQSPLILLRMQLKSLKLKSETCLSPPNKLPRLHQNNREVSVTAEQSIKAALEEIDVGIRKLQSVVLSTQPPAWLGSNIRSLLCKLEDIIPS